jgi:hypothetical protein
MVIKPILHLRMTDGFNDINQGIVLEMQMWQGGFFGKHFRRENLDWQRLSNLASFH